MQSQEQSKLGLLVHGQEGLELNGTGSQDLGRVSIFARLIVAGRGKVVDLVLDQEDGLSNTLPS